MEYLGHAFLYTYLCIWTLMFFFLLLPSIMHSILVFLVASLFLKLRKQLEARKTLWEHNKCHCAPWRAYWLCYCSWYDKINNNNNNVNLCFCWEWLKICWPDCVWFLVCPEGHFRGFPSLPLTSPPPAFRLPLMLFATCFTCVLHVLHALQAPEPTDMYSCPWWSVLS